MAERLLTEMIPRCIKLNTWKMGSGDYENACGIRTTENGWPLPGRDETEVGRWHVMGGRLLIDCLADPAYKLYVREAGLGLLVTDKSLRGSFYEGKGPVGTLSSSHHVLVFYWPYSLMAEPETGYYHDDRRLHVMIEDPSGDGHLGLMTFTQPRAKSPDDFFGPVFAMKNRWEEFFAQLTQTRAQHLEATTRDAVAEPTEVDGRRLTVGGGES